MTVEDDRAAGVAASELGANMAGLLPDVRRLVADVERDWLDPQGRAWVERIGAVQHALERELDVVWGVAARIAWLLAAEDGRPAAAARGSGRGPRLGDTDVERADDERGVRIAQLGDDAPG